HAPRPAWPGDWQRSRERSGGPADADERQRVWRHDQQRTGDQRRRATARAASSGRPRAGGAAYARLGAGWSILGLLDVFTGAGYGHGHVRLADGARLRVPPERADEW